MPKEPARAALGSGLGAFSSLLGKGGGTPALIMTMSGVNMHRTAGAAAGFRAAIAAPGALGGMMVGFNQPDLTLGPAGLVNLIALAAITAMSILAARANYFPGYFPRLAL